MKSMLGKLTIISGLALGLMSFNANAVLISSAGVWSNPTGTAANVNGQGTNQIFWGTDLGDGQSSWLFSGLTDFEAGDITDGSAFQLGTFIHFNNPIGNFNFLGADLGLSLDIGGNPVGPLAFTFGHNETSNAEPCNPAGATICPDVVSIPVPVSVATIIIDAIEYQMTIEGFKITADGPILTEFITEERLANRAFLFASLDRVVPEPSILALMGIGLLGLGLGFTRRRKSHQ